MLIELLSSSNYVNFNIRLAHILGLETAIYLAEIMNINDKALRKQKIDNDFFTIDRDYVEKRTTLDIKKQKDIEKTLLKIGILEQSDNCKDTICLNINVLTSILMNPDEGLIKNINKIIKQNAKSPKTAKEEKIKENLKQYISTSNEELIQAYSDWIDAVYTREGWMTKAAIIHAQQVVDSFSNRNLDLALKIIEIATISGFRDMTWAVNNYKKDYNVNYRINSIPQEAPVLTSPEVSEEVF